MFALVFAVAHTGSSAGRDYFPPRAFLVDGRPSGRGDMQRDAFGPLLQGPASYE